MTLQEVKVWAGGEHNTIFSLITYYFIPSWEQWMLFYGVKHPVGYVSCSKTFMGRLFLREREREFWFRAVCRPGKWESLACQLCFRKCQNILDEFQKYLYLFIFLKEVLDLFQSQAEDVFVTSARSPEQENVFPVPLYSSQGWLS